MLVRLPRVLMELGWGRDRGSVDSREQAWALPRGRLLVGVAVGLFGPALIASVLLGVRGRVDGGTVGLIMLAPTAVAAALGGPIAALVAVGAGTVLHNMLFTVPYLTLRMTEPSEVAGLAVHTVVAFTVSFVVVREQQAARLAARQQEATDRLRVLEEVDRARTALLGAVSHDLRTPLAAIAAASSELQEPEVSFDLEHRQLLLSTIAERAASLDRTVGQLLDASRLQAGAVTLMVEAVEVQDLVDEAVAAVGAAADGRIRLRIGTEAPPVLVDPVLIVVVLRNLFENALRHAPSPSPVLVDAAKAGDVVVVSVTDGGPGVAGDPEVVFEGFHGSSDGPGLGLAIARGFIELHGGQLDYHDAPAGGAVFEFTVPAVEEPES